MPELRQLTRQFARSGHLEAILLRPGRDLPVVSVPTVEALAGRGLHGDRAAAVERAVPGKRQVSLLQAEHLPLIAAWSGHEALDAGVLRRNLVVRGLNLLGARSPFADQPIHLLIGAAAVFEISGPCDPCSKIETALGRGGYNALRGHGGVTARVLQSGRIAVGDAVRVQPRA